MSILVARTVFVDAFEGNHSTWLFTAIGPLSNELRHALELDASAVELIVSVETVAKNLRNHRELLNIATHFRIAEAAIEVSTFEIIGSGKNSIRLFFEFNSAIWELVVKRSGNKEAICTSLHRANEKRLASARKNGTQYGGSRLKSK
jgi:hypothetical protein